MWNLSITQVKSLRLTKETFNLFAQIRPRSLIWREPLSKWIINILSKGHRSPNITAWNKNLIWPPDWSHYRKIMLSLEDWLLLKPVCLNKIHCRKKASNRTKILDWIKKLPVFLTLKQDWEDLSTEDSKQERVFLIP